MQEWEYDTDPISERRNVCWRATRIKTYDDLDRDQWIAHKQLTIMIRNLDDLVQKLHIESVACKRKNARTTKYKHLIREVEQMIDEIEQLTTVYGLEFFK